VHAAIAATLGADRVRAVDPVMGGEDFSEFGRTQEKVPICLFWLGAVEPAAFAEHERTGAPLPSLHSSKFAPAHEPAIRTGIAAMSAAALDLLGKK
jgi:hippurate hydrolase